MLLAIGDLAIAIVLGVLGIVLPDILVNFLKISTSVVILIFSIIGIINACNGEDKELPYIGKYAFYK